MKTVTIVGGGLVGLATAYRLMRSGRFGSVIVLEKEEKVAAHQSSHNSGVLHCGLYYQPGSLKARLAVQGLAQMLSFCEEHDVPHEVCGKIVLATSQTEEGRLRDLHARGKENGLQGLKWLGSSEIAKIEPGARGLAALFVPQEGIVDYRVVADRLVGKLREGGAEIRLGTRFLRARDRGETQLVETAAGEFETDWLITCAGLHSDRVAEACGEGGGSRIIPFRGDYYRLGADGRGLVRNLIYPVPDLTLPFLGVHFTRKIDGDIEAGPNAVLSFKREGYRKWDFSMADATSSLTFPGFYRFVARYPKATWNEFRNTASKRIFLQNLQKLVPDVRMEHLLPGGASGVRAQAIDRDGTLAMDFRIRHHRRRLHVVNAPSPGATACLAIGEYIVDQLEH